MWGIKIDVLNGGSCCLHLNVCCYFFGGLTFAGKMPIINP